MKLPELSGTQFQSERNGHQMLLFLLMDGFAVLNAEVNDKQLTKGTHLQGMMLAPRTEKSETKLPKYDFYAFWNRDSSVGIATGYGLEDREAGVRVSVGSTIFAFPQRLDRFWIPPSLLSNGYGGLFPYG
jgi:hypothetical protein